MDQQWEKYLAQTFFRLFRISFLFRWAEGKGRNEGRRRHRLRRNGQSKKWNWGSYPIPTFPPLSFFWEGKEKFSNSSELGFLLPSFPFLFTQEGKSFSLLLLSNLPHLCISEIPEQVAPVSETKGIL